MGKGHEGVGGKQFNRKMLKSYEQVIYKRRNMNGNEFIIAETVTVRLDPTELSVFNSFWLTKNAISHR